jgi:hypothetical protein
MVLFSTYATVKNGDFIGNSKVTLRFINSFLGTAERKLTPVEKTGQGGKIPPCLSFFAPYLPLP